MTNLNIHFTLVGSNIHDSFVDVLKSKPEEYAYTTVSSFAEYKPPADTEAHVIVLHGHDDELAKATTVAQLLDQPIILALFAPSKDILDALQDASKSLIHIPSIELEDGAPIIINRRPDDGVISLMPGFTTQTESIPTTERVEVIGRGTSGSTTAFIPTPGSSIPTAVPTLEEKLAINYAKSIDMIQLIVDHHLTLLHTRRDATQILEDGDHLKPPAGINFYKEIDLPVTFNSIPSPHDGQRFKYVYRVRVHAYCADARPTDPDFEKNRGEVHVVAVLRGEVFRDPQYNPRYISDLPYMALFLDSALFQARPQAGQSALIPMKGEPQYSQPINELDTIYKTTFAKTLNMWRADSMEPFVAQYGETFTRNQFKQTVQSREGGFDVLTYYDNYYDKSLADVPKEGAKGWGNVFDGTKIKPFPDDHFPLHALFYWSTSKLMSHTIDITARPTYVGFQGSPGQFKISLDTDHSQSHTLDLSANSWN